MKELIETVIAVTIAIAVIVLLSFGLMTLMNTATNSANINPAQLEFDNRLAVFEICIQSEKFSRDECLILAGSDDQ